MHEVDFIEKYEFKIKFNNENIEYLNYVLEALKKFDNKVVNCKVRKAADKIDPVTQKTTHWLSGTSDYWTFGSGKNSYQSKHGSGWVYVDYYITRIYTSDFIEDKRLKYDKLKELLVEKINYLKEINSQYVSVLENLDSILNKLAKLNDEAKGIFSMIPYGTLRELADLTSLGEKGFIKIQNN